MPGPGSAEVKRIAPDCPGARARLAAAERFAQSADSTGLHPEAAYVLRYDAARNALAAVLAAVGTRVGDGRGMGGGWAGRPLADYS
ncbi:MAG TPA: hypothetical protein VG015_01250 [Candidatus Dormibacteraeota bacterium]|jgi:hypothetical protein|nr:hypothetical protein [Candidatus Dormibacteraeota bacterium]